MMTDEEIINKAFLNATQQLHLPNNSDTDKVQIIKLYVSLNCLFGGDVELMRNWLNTHNNYLGFNPAAHLLDKNKLKTSIDYLESMMNY